jgi:hypothetical protein
MGRKKVSQWQINKIQRMLKAKKDPKKIASEVHVCRRTVINILEYPPINKKVEKMRRNNQPWEKIAEVIGSDLRTVKKPHFQAEVESQKLRMLKTRHIAILKNFSEEIRACLYNPSDIGNLLAIDSKSYVFDPITWFYLCTPNFDDELYWGKLLAQLRQHIDVTQNIDGSPFFEHYEKLKIDIDKLQLDYKRKAKVLSSENREFKLLWRKIQQSRKTKPTPSRVQHYTKMDVNYYSSFSEIKDDLLLLAELKEYIPDVNNRLDNINKQLKQLNDDFSPEQIDRLIETNTCDDPDCTQSE